MKKTILALSIAQMALATGAAYAQQASPDAPAASDDMEKIIVTATRRDTLVQDTPLAITAYTQDTLANNQVKDLATMTAMVPSLVVEPHSDSGGVHVYMRGVGSANHTELGDPAVAFYVDGIYVPRPQGATALMYDLNHVEVARGPQGTLNGRNSTAGAVNLVSGAPSTSKVFGSASIVLGDYHRVQTQGMINIPLSDDIALRIAAIKDQHDGYVDFRKGSNVMPGAQKYGAGNQQGARASLLWKFTPDLKATFIVDYYSDTGAGNIYLSAEPKPGQDLRSALIDTPGTLDQSIITAKTKVQWRPVEGIEAQYLGSWSRLKRSNASDADAGFYPGFKAENRTEWGQFDSVSNELQLRSDSEAPLQWVGGLFFFREKNKIRFDIDRSQISEAMLAQDIANGSVIFVQPTVGQYASAMSFIQGDRQLHSKAAFAQASYELDPVWKLTAGARYTKDHKYDIGGQNWACPNWPDNAPRGATLTPSQIAQLVTPGVGTINTHNIGPGGVVNQATCGNTYGDNTADLAYGQATWLGRVEYKLSKDILTFASVTTGFHSPAIGDGGATTKPEKLTSYEIGFKSDLLDHKLSLNIDGFWMKYKDKLESQVVNNTLQNFNAAGASVKGVEAEWAWRPTNVDRFSGNATWLKARYDDFLSCDVDAARANGQSCGTTAPTVNVGGSVLKHAPTFAATLMYEHDFTLGKGRVTPRVSLHHESESFVGSGAFSNDVPGHPGVKMQAAYSTLDLSVRYEPFGKAYTAELFVNNATDKEVKYDAIEVCTQVGAPCQPTQQIWAAYYNNPRTFGARVSMKF
ncbi:iron complex outermembrane recepter protein [Duganella sacchari]|uniref:Iron complex outermembrane recepter protein n=1 Tax=Duganella sacchari TaxID=551987 RepID=A0A1M7R3I2_9BURK|nr:TonB-dependent receptor [Duganella sacchari]SHN39698.1 iron complex outermembrane recepter protein [Duganella sacchari]